MGRKKMVQKKKAIKNAQGRWPNHQGSRPIKKGALDRALESLEEKMILDALMRHKCSVLEASRELGCNRGGLYKRMERLGLEIVTY